MDGWCQANATMRLCDHSSASALRVTANWDLIPSALFMQPISAGWTGIMPATVVMSHAFLMTFIRQLLHLNDIVRISTTRSIWRAYQRFHPDMSCISDVLAKCAWLILQIMTEFYR